MSMRFTPIVLASFVLLLVSSALSAEFGTADEARTMLDRVVVEMKADSAGTLAKINEGAERFRDRDLYPFCSGPDGVITAHPMLVGKQLRDLRDADGKMFGEEMLKVAEDGKIAEVKYKWPRPGSTQPMPKVSFITKIGDQVCGVGYYK
jgi:signal transduction histidine kinase